MKSSLRNFGSKLYGEGGVRLSSFIFISILARRLGVAEFGVYSTIFAFSTLMSVCVESINNTIITREVARHPEKRAAVLWSANLLKILFAVLTLTGIHVLGALPAFVHFPRATVDLLGAVVLSYSLIDYAGALLAGREELGQEASLRALCRGLIAITGIVAVLIKPSLQTIVAAMAVSSLISLVIAQRRITRRFPESHFIFDRAMVRELLLKSFPLVATYLFAMLYENQSVLLLQHFRVAPDQLGLFVSATKILSVLKVVPILLAGAFFPSLSRAPVGSPSFSGIVRHLFRDAMVLAPPIAVVTFFSAPLLQHLFFGRDFIAAAPLLKLLSIVYAATFMNYISTYIVIAGNRERHLLIGSVSACALNFLLCWLWIPRWGTYGVCDALIVCEALYLVYQATLVWRCVRTTHAHG